MVRSAQKDAGHVVTPGGWMPPEFEIQTRSPAAFGLRAIRQYAVALAGVALLGVYVIALPTVTRCAPVPNDDVMVICSPAWTNVDGYSSLFT